MKVKLLKIEHPANGNWGIIQINNFSNTYFRFDFQNGAPVLDTNFFADGVDNPGQKHKKLDKTSELYQAVQQLLHDYFTKTPFMDTEKERAFAAERRSKLNQLLECVNLMDGVIQRGDSEVLEKLKQDFSHVLEQLAFVEKRS